MTQKEEFSEALKILEEIEENDSDYEPDEYGCVEEDLEVNVDERGFYSLA